MSQVGEDRLADGVEKRGESSGADKVLGEYAADPPVFLPDAVTWTLRVAKSLYRVAVELLAPASRNGPRIEAIHQTEVA